MFQFTRALPLLFGLATAGLAASSGLASAGTDGPHCTITEHVEGGMRRIQGSVTSPKSVSGEYHLALKAQGNGSSSTVSQGGPFSVRANEPTAIAQMSIDRSARFSIDFSITLDGRTIDCTREGALAT